MTSFLLPWELWAGCCRFLTVVEHSSKGAVARSWYRLLKSAAFWRQEQVVVGCGLLRRLFLMHQRDRLNYKLPIPLCYVGNWVVVSKDASETCDALRFLLPLRYCLLAEGTCLNLQGHVHTKTAYGALRMLRLLLALRCENMEVYCSLHNLPGENVMSLHLTTRPLSICTGAHTAPIPDSAIASFEGSPLAKSLPYVREFYKLFHLGHPRVRDSFLRAVLALQGAQIALPPERAVRAIHWTVKLLPFLNIKVLDGGWFAVLEDNPYWAFHWTQVCAELTYFQEAALAQRTRPHSRGQKRGNEQSGAPRSKRIHA